MAGGNERHSPDRRTVVVGGALIVAAAVPAILGTRRRAQLLGGNRLDTLVPTEVAGWRTVPSGVLVGPDDPDQGLYDALLQRTYASPGDPTIMLAVAYGMAAILNRHRPDICYPAQGFTIDRQEASTIALTPGVAVRGQRLLARRGARLETIAYWRRMGDTIPPASDDEAMMIWQRSLMGEIPDGALVRMSMIGGSYEVASAALERFAAALISASPPATRLVLLGRVTALATLRRGEENGR